MRRALALLLVVVVACGSETAPGRPAGDPGSSTAHPDALATSESSTTDPVALVIAGPPPASPYAGSLSMPTASPDETDLAVRGGVAAAALECSGKLQVSEIGSSAHRQPTAADALQRVVNEGYLNTPKRGYRAERSEAGRVLFSYDVDGATKVAVVVSDKGSEPGSGDVGWRVETLAACDAAELPDAVTDELGVEVWTDRNGERVPTSIVQSRRGPEHCNWQSITFLHVEGQQYIRDEHGDLKGFGSSKLKATFDADTTVPPDARETGYSLHGRALWIAADRSSVYVVAAGNAERWPAPVEQVGCA